MARRPTGTPRASATSGSTVANVSGGRRRRARTSVTTPIADQEQDVATAHAGDRPEQDREGLGRIARVERQEQHAEPEAEGHDDPDDGVPLAQPDPERADEQGGDRRARRSPITGETPMRIAPAAPVKPSSARAWTANDMLRATTKRLTTPATIAMTMPAAIAFWAKS